MYQADYEVRILCDCADPTRVERLRTLLRDFAQEEHLSVSVSLLRSPRLTIPCGRKVYHCSRKDLLYITSDGHYSVVHTNSGSTRLRISFHEISALVQASGYENDYLLVNRGILLARSHIIGHTHDAFLMDNGDTLPVRRPDRTRLFQEFDKGQ